MRRWSVRILAIIAALLATALVGGQLLLWSKLPRQIVLNRLESQLHLRFSIGNVSTGWLGHATLHDVKAFLPLSDQPILEADTVRARHTSVFGLLFGHDFSISELDIDKPTLRLVRGPDGRWNFQQAADLIGSPGQTKSASDPVTSLPRLRIAGATIDIVDGTRQCTIGDVAFNGFADSALSWRFALGVPKHVQIKGRLVPGLEWQHEAEIQASDVSAWIHPWFNFSQDASLVGTWRGRLVNGQMRGRAQIGRAVLAGSQAAGGIDVLQTVGAVELRPDNLVVTTNYPSLKDVTALSGSLSFQNNLIHAEGVQLQMYGGPATISGYYDLAAQIGHMQAGWDRLALPGGIVHGGNLTASVRRPFPAQLVLEGTLFSFASTSQGPWRAQLDFGAQTDAGSDLSWHVNASELAWNRRNPIKLDGLHLTGVVHQPAAGAPTLMLSSASLPDANAMSGAGFYNLANRTWELTLQGSRWPMQLVRGAVIAFDISAAGNTSRVDLRRFNLRQAESSLSATGSYRYGIPKPLHISADLVSPESYQPALSHSILGGAIRGKTELVGTLLPLKLDLSGQLSGHHVSFADRSLGHVILRLSGQVNRDKAELQTERLRLLDGDWYFRGTYAFAEELLDVDLRVGGLPVKNLGEPSRTQSLQGVMDGDWDAYILSLPLSAQKIRLRGHGSIRDFRANALAADEVDFTTTMDDGLLSADPIAIKYGGGHGTGSLSWDINSPGHIDGAIALSDWPVRSGDARATVQLDIPQVALDLPQPATEQFPARPLQIMTNSAEMRVAAQWQDKPVGELTLSGDSDGRIATVRQIGGTLLGANLRGQCVYDLDAPLATQGTLQFDELDSARIVELVPALSGLTGKLHGAATLGPATSAHPLEPLALGMAVQFDQAHYRGIPIGLLNLNLFMNTDRIVLDDRADHGSTIDIAQGSARFWGRARRRQNQISSQAEVQIDNVNLDQIARAIDPVIAPTPGEVSGGVMLLYNSPYGPAAPAEALSVPSKVSPAVQRFLTDLYGEATLTLTHSNIATVPVISDLYTLMSLGQGSRGPIGTGAAWLRLEHGGLHVRDVSYTNRGIDARIQLDSPQMWNFPDNPIAGYAIGSAEPLAALKLPLIADLQTALTAVENNFTPLQISGTWKKIQTAHVAFAAIGQTMRELLMGDIGGDNSSPAPQ